MSRSDPTDHLLHLHASKVRAGLQDRKIPWGSHPTPVQSTNAALTVAMSQRCSMAPQLAYGRHRGPVPKQVRQAAVLVAMFQHPELGWVVPLTIRPKHLEHHPGQICFPGGGVEQDEDHESAARREFTEELGVPTIDAIVVGELSRIYVYASRHCVTPVVCLMPQPTPSWIPDPSEVADVIEFPLRSLRQPESQVVIRKSARVELKRPRDLGYLSKENFEIESEPPSSPDFSTRLSRDDAGKDAEMHLHFDAPCYSYLGHHIWGATAMMLHELSAALPSDFF